MNTIIRLSEVLHAKYGYYVPTNKNEFDELIVPKEVVDHLEGTIQTETAAYTDEAGVEYSTW